MRKIALLSVLVATACTTPVAPPPPSMTFSNLQPMSVNVAQVNSNVMSGKTSGAFVADPAQVAQNYMKARFSPSGGGGSLDATVEEATVTTQEKQSVSRVARFLDVDNIDVYNITLRVRFEHKRSDGSVQYGKVLTARRMMQVSEHASVAEREGEEVKSLERMFNDIDREVVHMVREDMRI